MSHSRLSNTEEENMRLSRPLFSFIACRHYTAQMKGRETRENSSTGNLDSEDQHVLTSKRCRFQNKLVRGDGDTSLHFNNNNSRMRNVTTVLRDQCGQTVSSCRHVT
ncbi:hypothetical protein F2P81_021745 [Scophthalmus maximus]|uniref:Uncharacterized protein n=1 Tax=Scophthalmus maximus TaxID=52904 RepID=A0A6A4S4A5_SCOMX|nr:hypothetical protein F2P81_021745 [Scophthalmus maximus]